MVRASGKLRAYPALCWHLAYTWRVARAVLLGAAVIPHGDQAFDPSIPDCDRAQAECIRLHNASMEAGRFVVQELLPDLIFLTTPHGLELGTDFLVYQNSQEAGNAPVGNVPHSQVYMFPFNFSTNTRMAEALSNQLRARGLRVQGLQGFSDSEPLPVSWGEIMPLSYIWNASRSLGRAPPLVVVMGVPSRRFNHSFEMVQEMLTLGGALAELLDEAPERVAWVVSSDLAHTHSASGPYGYCDCAQPFDDAVGSWLTSLNSTALLVDATSEQKRGASSCGFTGLVLLEGALAATRGPRQWNSSLLVNEHPTYYGMAAATLRRAHPEPSTIIL